MSGVKDPLMARRLRRGARRDGPRGAWRGEHAPAGPAPAGSSIQVEGETHAAQKDHPQGKRSDRARPGRQRRDHRPRGIMPRTESLAGPRR